ncbi:hypothetical protein ACIO6U_24680 [Streptomyces sp. NPDC087422]|uniref:hypothetical protein n=1 Tax=Streptomyces sp. NPDC087422 TaxID=3365786 RepID=UPI00380B9299
MLSDSPGTTSAEGSTTDSPDGRTYREAGPLERTSWDSRLTCNVVDPSVPLRMHGYGVFGDLARHYRFSELAFLAWRGELPAESEAVAMETAWTLLMPVPLTDAGAHAALLARITACPPAQVLSVAAITLAESAQGVLDEHTAWLEWLRGPEDTPPAAYAASTPDDQAAWEAVPADAKTLLPGPRSFVPTVTAGALALLFCCGLRDPQELITSIVMAQLPAVTAEVLRHSATEMLRYPINLPPVRYVPESEGNG